MGDKKIGLMCELERFRAVFCERTTESHAVTFYILMFYKTEAYAGAALPSLRVVSDL